MVLLGAIAALAALVTGAACSPSAAEPPGKRPSDWPAPPADWDSSLRLREVVDLNPDPDIVEIELTAEPAMKTFVPGTQTPVWTYNGDIPGPLIRVRKGNRLIVHFKNHLPEETTVHWHGLRIPVEMDGVPGHSQEPIPAGGTFDYGFVVPDAGLFWYHPHFRSAAQAAEGLYGALLVEDDKEPPGIGDELVIVLSDIGVAANGSMIPHDSGGDLGTLFGREGNILLANGRVNPTLKATPGLRQRWRIVNAAISRYFQIGLAGNRFVRIGGDGGLSTASKESDYVVLTPGERADVVIEPNGVEGTEVPLRWIPYDRGFGSTFNRPEETVATVKFEGAPARISALPILSRNIEPLSTEGATLIDLRLTAQTGSQPYTLGINDIPFEEHLPAKVGETQVWTVRNTFDFAHPFHLHGFFFQVLDDAGQPVQPLEWKDTVDVPVGGYAKMVVRYDDRPGVWMFHCHILDHADAGMMGMLDLQP
jgi:FtsP/CotA-like multicopper oxidase with cupredoxin domain